METVLRIVAALSFVAFVVGMFNPKVVKCSSRGKAALVYIGIFIVAVFIGVSLSEESSTSVREEATGSTAAQKQEKSKEIPVLSKGSVYTMPYANKDVQITFADIRVNKIPNQGLNLVFTLRIKNNSNEQFFISNSDWKLLDSDKTEVEESGIYEPMFDDFAPGMFFFTVVEPNIGKEEKVGYSVKKETYYLSIDGKVIAKIPLDANMK
ncbi:MAG: hypothetical protein ACI3YG_04765 [Prevotella sp.]